MAKHSSKDQAGRERKHRADIARRRTAKRIAYASRRRNKS